MHKTPWTKGAANTPASSLPSERLRPKNNNNNIQPKQGQQKSKSQQQQQPGSVQKSKAVRDLESLISNLESHNITPIRDPKGGCFCLGQFNKKSIYLSRSNTSLICIINSSCIIDHHHSFTPKHTAREHPLSLYTPLCTSCGLILCNLNKPYHTCPHCNTDGGILTPQQRTSLLTQLRETLDSTLAQEETDRVRQIEEAKKAAGAFPTLSSSGGGGTTKSFTVTPTPTLPQQQHKVLSLTPANKSKGGGGGNRKTVVTVSSYTSTPVSSRPATPSSVNSATGGEVENRVLPPPQTVHYVVANHQHHHHQHQPRSNSRPWQNFGDGGGISVSVRYCAPVSPPPDDALEVGGEGGSTDPEKTKSRRKGKGKGGGGGGGPRGSG